MGGLPRPVTALGGTRTCAGIIALTAIAYYQSRPNFRGRDRLTYARINQGNPRDRLSGEFTMPVTVR